ncbi:DUF5694 domain-containing protein [Sporosarcina sp. Te-1]|uniref:DUF5694 domain-containing protein n=1 Tax=Sporosarcina sp. Te-1 TaxID=2818390 RepID=UPI001A9E8302|nr:DUF5694 domain-containing protein [Sporosarcina sp. Te-1]QTD40106.1 hypothetical protein J3U78_14930 [Sporosarcina sp. Te-1]
MDYKIENAKPKVMVVGMFHMGETPDQYKVEVDNLLSEKRQREIGEVVERLGAFKPTKVAVELEKKHNEWLNDKYKSYLEGTYELEVNEIDQIGFRLAKEADQPEIYAIDWMEQGSCRKDFGEVYEWAKEYQPELFQDLFGWLEESPVTRGFGSKSVLEMLQEINEEELNRQIHQTYLNMSRLKTEEEYVGMDWLNWWYERNLILYSNLLDLASASDERILFLVGGSHVEIVSNFLRESGKVVVEPALPYLNESEDAQKG